MWGTCSSSKTRFWEWDWQGKRSRLLGWRNSTGREATCQTWNRSWKVRIYQRFQELAENDLCWWWLSLRRMVQWRVHEKLYWDKRQNPLTSEKVLREYSESLNPLKLFYLKTQTSFTASSVSSSFTTANVRICFNSICAFVSHSLASLNNKPMFLPFTYSNDNMNN